MSSTVSRRQVLAGSAVAGVAVLIGVESAHAAPQILPPNYPPSIALNRRVFRNWDGVIVTDALWTAEPRSSADVVQLANWAHQNGYTIRPSGFQHNWSPLTVDPGSTTGDRVIIVDTTRHLTKMSIPQPHRVTAQSGVEMSKLLAFLEGRGYGLASAPAPGDVTVGGVLAVNAHGTAVRASGEGRQTGQSFGTMSNLVTSLTAVVWDDDRQQYVERTFDRADPETKALLVSLGRIFVTEVTLQVMKNYNLRSRSYTDISTRELFAHPSKQTGRSLSKLLDQSGRVGLIWYTYTDRPWVQVWDVTPNKPLFSRRTVGPFNYPFADNLPNSVTSVIAQIISGKYWLAPIFGRTVLTATSAGLTATGARDMWGPSKNFLHFVKPTTLRVSAGSHVVITSRDNVQRVVHEFAEYIEGLLAKYRQRGQYPLNSCVEIRVTGLDDPAEVDVPGAEAPSLSAARPVDGRPELDTAVWLDALNLPGTPHEYELFSEMERWIIDHFSSYAVVRPEWAKRWATTPAGPWTDDQIFDEFIPQAFSEWDWAIETLERYDPHQVFTSPLLRRLLRR